MIGYAVNRVGAEGDNEPKPDWSQVLLFPPSSTISLYNIGIQRDAMKIRRRDTHPECIEFECSLIVIILPSF